MQRFNLARFLEIVVLLGLLLGGAVACGGPDETEQTQVPPTPTTQILESPLSPTATLPPLVLETGAGGAKGVLVSFPSRWAGSELFVWFSPFYSGEKADEGIFVLDPSSHPSTRVEGGGYFQLGNIPPARYVVVIGPSPQEALAIRKGDRPEIFEVSEGEILEMGEIHLGE